MAISSLMHVSAILATRVELRRRTFWVVASEALQIHRLLFCKAPSVHWPEIDIAILHINQYYRKVASILESYGQEVYMTHCVEY